MSIVQEQRTSYFCGPASLSSCLAVLGIEADQDEIYRTGNTFFDKLRRDGMDEHELKQAARKFGAKCQFVAAREELSADELRQAVAIAKRRRTEFRPSFRGFRQSLAHHLRQGLPAMLCVNHYGDYGHWVAVHGVLNGEFIVMDPAEGSHAFELWSPDELEKYGRNDPAESDDEEEETAEFFAILVSRKDGKPAPWNVSQAFLAMLDVDTDQSPEVMASDLTEIAWRAAGSPERYFKGARLHKILADRECMILDSVWHWVANPEVTKAELKKLYRAYTIVAAAADIRVSQGTDLTE